MKNTFQKSVRALILGTLSLGLTAMPGPREAVASISRVRTYTYTVWAHSLRDGDYGHHDVSFQGATEQEALNKLKIYELAWGQQLQRARRHYNSIESRCIRVD
jgi:hypothetical protein